jgi:hypothetical protein
MKKFGLIFTILTIILCFSGVAFGDNLLIEGSNLIYSDGFKDTNLLSGVNTRTIGDGAAEDTQVNFDGNADDWHLCLDDTDDDFAIGYGTTCGTDHRISIVDDANNTTVILGDAVSGYDTVLTFDGNADDWHVCLDDTDDDIEIGYGASCGTDPRISIVDDANNTTIVLGDAVAGYDTLLYFDGNADDFYCGIDDTDDDFKCGHGSTMASDMYMRWADTAPTITFGNATGAVDINLVLDGNAQDFHVGLQDSSDDLFIGLGAAAGTTPAISVDENQVVTMYQDPIFGGTTPTVTIGDGGNEDNVLVFNEDADDWYIGFDATDNDLKIGGGTTMATDRYLTFFEDATTMAFGNAAEADIMTYFDGAAQDYYICLDDNVDDLAIGLGSACGTTPAITIDENQVMTVLQDPLFTGTTPTITVGDGGDEDTGIVFNSDTVDYYIFSENGADDLNIGVGSTPGSNISIGIAQDSQVTITNSIMYPAEVVTATNVITAAECGKTFFLNSGTEFQSTLPAVSTVSIGCEFSFIVQAAPSGADYTIITGNTNEDVLHGGFVELETDTGNDGPHSKGTPQDEIEIKSALAQIGDRIDLVSNGSLYFMSGFTNTVGGFVLDTQ